MDPRVEPEDDGMWEIPIQSFRLERSETEESPMSGKVVI